MTKQDALGIIAALEELTKRFGCPDEDAMRTIEKNVFALSSQWSGTAYFREKLGAYRDWAKIGLSTRKFEKFPGGLDQVRSWAISDCWAMRNLVERASDA